MKMKMINKITLSLVVATGILFTGCNDSVEVAKSQVVKKTISEESLGLRKTDLYSEAPETAGAKTQYGTSYAGSGHKIQRAFQDAPPMIPHDVTGMIPVKINNNQCIGCHMPDVAPSVGATPVPVSHLTNFRPKNQVVNGVFKKEVDNMQNGIIIHKAGSKLVGARFNCTQCHAPQSTGKLAVENTFKPVYTSKDGASRSSWNGDMMTYGLDTLGKDSGVTEKDLKNENSPAGHLEGRH